MKNFGIEILLGKVSKRGKIAEQQLSCQNNVFLTSHHPWGIFNSLWGIPAELRMSLVMASSGPAHGLSGATGPSPVRIVSVDGAGVEGKRTPGGKGPSGLNLPYP